MIRKMNPSEESQAHQLILEKLQNDIAEQPSMKFRIIMTAIGKTKNKKLRKLIRELGRSEV